MVFKVVGADENGLFPTRVMTMLRTYFNPAKNTGTRVALLGDSITDFNFDYANYPTTVQTTGRGYFVWANILLRQRFTSVSPSTTDGAWGASGMTAATMLTGGESAGAAASASDIVIVLAGTNDLTDSANYTAAQIAANLQSIWNMQLNAGKRVVACTIMPRNNNDSAAIVQKLRDTNRLIRKNAIATLGVTLCDWYGVLLDSSTNLAKSGTYYIDGIHPNSMGASRMGTILANVLDKAFPISYDDLPFDNADTNNFIPNGLMTGTGGSGSTATGTYANNWTCFGSSSGVVGSKVARSDLQAGEWQQIVVPSGGNFTFQNYINIGGANQPAVGDLIYVTSEFEIDAASYAGTSLSVSIEFNGSSNVARGPSYGEVPGIIRLPSGILRTPAIPVPSGATIAKMNISASGTGTYRFGRSQMVKI